MAFLATDFLSRGRLGPEASGLLGFGVGRKCPSASALSTLWVWVSSGRKRSLGAYPLPPPHSHLLTEPNAQGGEGRTQEGGPRVCVTRSPEPRRAEFTILLVFILSFDSPHTQSLNSTQSNKMNPMLILYAISFFMAINTLQESPSLSGFH